MLNLLQSSSASGKKVQCSHFGSALLSEGSEMKKLVLVLKEQLRRLCNNPGQRAAVGQTFANSQLFGDEGSQSYSDNSCFH